MRTTSALQMSVRCVATWLIKRDNTVKQELNISSAFLSTCLFCLDCVVASTACLFNRLGSQIPLKGDIILQWQKVNLIISLGGKWKGRGGLVQHQETDEAHVLTYLCSQRAVKFPVNISFIIWLWKGPEKETDLRVVFCPSDDWLLISFSSTQRRFWYYFLVTHPSLYYFPIKREAVWFPFVALVPPIFQRWDPAKFQSQSVLYKVRMCLNSYKHEDMIETCLRRGENMCVYVSAGSRHWLYSLTGFVLTVDHLSFIMVMLNRAAHLHTACRILSLGGMLICCWCLGSSTEWVEAGWHHFAVKGKWRSIN